MYDDDTSQVTDISNYTVYTYCSVAVTAKRAGEYPHPVVARFQHFEFVTSLK